MHVTRIRWATSTLCIGSMIKITGIVNLLVICRFLCFNFLHPIIGIVNLLLLLLHTEFVLVEAWTGFYVTIYENHSISLSGGVSVVESWKEMVAFYFLRNAIFCSAWGPTTFVGYGRGSSSFLLGLRPCKSICPI